MKKLLRGFLLGLMSISLILSVPAMSTSAITEEMPSDIKVAWYYPEKLVKVEKNEKELVLHVTVNGKEQSLSLTFPTSGGFRLHAEKAGFFEPSGVNAINYKGDSNGVLTMAGNDGCTVKLMTNKSPWALYVYNKSNKLVVAFAANQMWFGYQGDTLRKVKLEAGIADKEVLYGLGERFSTFNQVGLQVLLWNRDCWSAADKSYKNIPILHSSIGYMLFFNSTNSAVADIGKTNNRKYSLDFNGPKFDFYIWTGTPLENITGYTSLTGTPILPPKWVFQYWAGASGQTWESEGEANYLKLLQECLNGYADLGTPNIAALYGEGAPSTDTKAYNMLNKNGTRMLAWNNPFQSRDDMKYWLPDISMDIKDNQLPAYKNALNPWTYLSTNTMDYSHPTAYDLVKTMWGKKIGWGLRGLMIDYGESVPESALAYNGLTGDEMHNFFSYHYAKVHHDVFKDMVGDDFILFARNATAGSQVWTANFGGDQAGTFDGLQKAITGVLSLSTCGFSTWGSDIGGYGGSESSDVYRRWTQFGTFSPLMRLHGQGKKDPWHFGTEAEQTFVSHYWLRENLLNKIYSSAIQANKNGRPMVQSMAVAFPTQTKLAAINDQYIFCDDFLVCPVVSANAYYRKVVFPKGTWVDIWTGEVIQGGGERVVDAPQNWSPVYIRSGSVVPVKVSSHSLELTDTMLDDTPLDALLVTPADITRETTYWSDENTLVKHTSSGKNNTITVQSDQKNNAGIVLAYGVNAISVKVDGKSLEKLEYMPTETTDCGYYVDGTQKTVIRVSSSHWSEMTIEKAGTSYIDLALNKTITSSDTISSTNDVKNLVDGDIFTQWAFSPTADTWVELDLGETKKISEVVLKWNISYANAYTVQTSVDGEDWKEVYNTEESDGNIDTLQFEETPARYVRMLDMMSAKKEKAFLYSFEVYSPYAMANAQVEWTDDDLNSEDPGNPPPSVSVPDADSDSTISADGTTTSSGATETNADHSQTGSNDNQNSLPVIGGNGGSTITIVLIVLGVFVLAAAGSVTFWLIKKKKATTDAGVSEDNK